MVKELEIPVSGRPFKNNTTYCVGTGRIGLALQKEYLDHLEIVQQSIGFKYIRGHGIFSDDVGIYREYELDGETHTFYNFTYLDRIIDSYLEQGIRPFLELGFMPEKLKSGEETIFYWKGNVSPPTSYEKWAELVKATLNHLIDRYGREEVITWPVEVWNEPNIGF
ncbi:MAG: xylan 1,4-beta-xylosidase, partial [Halanaerobiaceae bacterium]|nr:xylan 1,4-beta-xylosidase [Halanaerobiaceae bacterium]